MANSHNNLGELLHHMGKPAEAEDECRPALAIQQKLADLNPAVTDFRRSLANSHNNLNNVLSHTGKPAEAEAECRAALAIQQKLADDNPAVTDFRKSLAGSHHNLGSLLSGKGKPAEAEAEYRKALAILQKLADDNPAVTDFRDNLGARLNIHGWSRIVPWFSPGLGLSGRSPAPGAFIPVNLLRSLCDSAPRSSEDYGSNRSVATRLIPHSPCLARKPADPPRPTSSCRTPARRCASVPRRSGFCRPPF